MIALRTRSVCTRFSGTDSVSIERWKSMKNALIVIAYRAVGLLLLGLAYALVHRSLKTWYR